MDESVMSKAQHIASADTKRRLLVSAELFVRAPAARERARAEAPLNVLAAGGSNISMELTACSLLIFRNRPCRLDAQWGRS